MIGVVKLFLLWVVAALWFLVCAYTSVTYFREAFAAGRGFFERPQSILTGIGGLTVATLPLIAAALVHRYHKSRLRGRLEREKARIERQLARLDEKEGQRLGAPADALRSSHPLP